jgi:hypothetical protein
MPVGGKQEIAAIANTDSAIHKTERIQFFSTNVATSSSMALSDDSYQPAWSFLGSPNVDGMDYPAVEQIVVDSEDERILYVMVYQFRFHSLQKLIKSYQLNALCPIWQVGNLTKSYQLLPTKEVSSKKAGGETTGRTPSRMQVLLFTSSSTASPMNCGLGMIQIRLVQIIRVLIP